MLMLTFSFNFDRYTSKIKACTLIGTHTIRDIWWLTLYCIISYSSQSLVIPVVKMGYYQISEKGQLYRTRPYN